MPNLASVLKSEIRRLARREAHILNAELRQIVKRERAKATGLRKQVVALEQSLKRLGRAKPAGASAQAPADDSPRLRWRKDTISVLRRRHDLSQQALAKLLGVGLNTVWSWEKGRSTPRRGQLVAIAALRSASKPELMERLSAVGLDSGRGKPGRKPGSKRRAGAKPGRKAGKKAGKKTAKKAARRTATRHG